MVFQTKKIKSETLGEYLKAVRTAFKLSLNEASEGARVNSKLLKALEEGKMSELPADVYAQGVLKQLAIFYQLEEADLIFQYKKEISIERKIGGKGKFAVKQLSNFWKQLVITPKVLLLGIVSLFIVLTLVYLFWQVSSINRAPSLLIISPKDQQIIEGLSVKVAGVTDPGDSALVNGQEIFVDREGNFNTSLSLVPGAQEIKVESKNRYGKQTQKIVKVFIKPQDIDNNQILTLVLNFSGDGSFKFSVDGAKIEEKDFKEGENFEIKAKDNIVLSAADGALLQANFQGQDLGRLGKPGEALTNLTFSRESATINNIKQ